MQTSRNIQNLMTSFVDQIGAVLDHDVKERITSAFARVFGGPPKPSPSPRQARKPPRVERRSASPAATRARKLQGQYLGALRSLSAGDRKKVKAVAQSTGVADAVKLAHAIAAKGKRGPGPKRAAGRKRAAAAKSAARVKRPARAKRSAAAVAAKRPVAAKRAAAVKRPAAAAKAKRSVDRVAPPARDQAPAEPTAPEVVTS
jgi:hypothetical protein